MSAFPHRLSIQILLHAPHLSKVRDATKMDWKPHPSLDPSLLPTIQSIIERIPLNHLLPPKSKEIFDNPEAAYDRLQDWAFSQGFCVVVSSHAKNVLMRFACKHHGSRTRNTRKLDNKANKDSNRSHKYTHIASKGCLWKCYISWKDKIHGHSDKAWILGVTDGIHNHEMVSNPLSYDTHRR
jgi:hypothetical protein